MGMFEFGWLPRALFKITMALALMLGTTVLVAPFVARWNAARGSQVMQLFAHDATLRKTAVASACGLAVTACVFFRSPRTARKEPEATTRNLSAE
jgi:hypothetical protein